MGLRFDAMVAPPGPGGVLHPLVGLLKGHGSITSGPDVTTATTASRQGLTRQRCMHGFCAVVNLLVENGGEAQETASVLSVSFCSIK